MIQTHPILEDQRSDYYSYLQLPVSIELHLSSPTLPPKPVLTEPKYPL
jgi:hypothetical protein